MCYFRCLICIAISSWLEALAREIKTVDRNNKLCLLTSENGVKRKQSRERTVLRAFSHRTAFPLSRRQLASVTIAGVFSISDYSHVVWRYCLDNGFYTSANNLTCIFLFRTRLSTNIYVAHKVKEKCTHVLGQTELGRQAINVT